MQELYETWVQSLGGEDPLEKGVATHSSVLAWRIPCTEEPGVLPSIALQRVRHDWSYLAGKPSSSLYTHCKLLAFKWHTHSTVTVLKWKVKVLVTQSCGTLCDPMDRSPWNSPDRNTKMAHYALLQRIFLAQGLNPGLLHCRHIPYCLSDQESRTDLSQP